MLVQGFFWLSAAFGIYQNVYLQGHGFTSSQIGVLNGIVSAVTIFAMTFWGVVSDRINSIKRSFMIALALGAVLYAAFPLIPTDLSVSFVLFVLYASLANFARGPAPVLLDNISVRSCTEQKLNFGTVRSAGSLCFTIGGFVIVWLISRMGVESTFWLSGLAAVPCLLMLLFVRDPKAQIADQQKIDPAELFKNYHYVMLLIFCAILYIGLSGEYTFLTYLMEEKNIPIEKFGTVLGMRSMMEIPLLLVISRLHRRFKLKHLLWVACSLMGLECILLGVWAQSYIEFLGAMVCFGLGNGIFVGTIPVYIYKQAPEHLKASAQTIFSSVYSVSAIVGNVLGGFVYRKTGGDRFYIMLGIIMLAAVVFFIVSANVKRDIPNPADEKC